MAKIFFYDFHPVQDHLSEEIYQKLNLTPRWLPYKLFYDAKGSELFDQICMQPEYYVTWAENQILEQYAQEIAQAAGVNSLIAELGSGNSQKIRKLLPYFNEITYMPMDISKHHLNKSACNFSRDFPHIPVHAVCMDYTQEISLPFSRDELKKNIFFFGSSVSNFEPAEVREFLKKMAKLLTPQGGLLIGVDLDKDPKIINEAYNDSQGVTAAFNLNILHHINTQFSANFIVENYKHEALYNAKSQRMEMQLISLVSQEVKIGDRIFRFNKNEIIRTENSYKYTVEQFHHLALAAGFRTQKYWLDKHNLFSVHYFSF